MIAIFLAWLVGIVLQLQQAQLWSMKVYVVLLVFAVLGMCGISYLWGRLNKGLDDTSTKTIGQNKIGVRWAWFKRGVIILLMLIAGFSWAGLLAANRMGDAINPIHEQQDIIVVGVVEDLPQMQSGRWRFILGVKEAFYLEGETEKGIELPARLLLSWYFHDADQQSVPDIKSGQEWSFEVRLKAPHGSLNPDTFDYELWLWSQNIGAVGYVRTAKNSPTPELLGEGAAFFNMSQWRESVRRDIMQTIPDARQAGLLTALTLGDQRAIDQEDWDLFRVTGIVHLVSISGLHITMMAWLMYGLISWLWRRSMRLMLWQPAHVVAMVLGLLCAIMYAWFTGWGVPAQRTVMMLGVVVLLRLVGIRWPWYVVWLCVAVVIVTIDPWAILQAGFWLSFVAVGVLFAQSIQNTHQKTAQDDIDEALQSDVASIKALLPQPLWRRCLMKVWQEMRLLLTIQLRISIALAPLTLLLFQQVSIVGLLVNMFAIPWVTFLIVPLSLLGVIFHPLWHVAAWCADLLLWVLDWFSSLPLAVVYGATPPLAVAIMAMFGAIVLVLPLFRWRYRGLAALFIVPVFCWPVTKPAHGELEVLFLDVGQGSSVLIRTEKHALLYDAGPKYSAESDAGSVLIVPTLRSMGVRLDRIVISHADNDHAGGLGAVWKNYPQADVLYSVADENAFQKSLPSTDHAMQRQDCVAGLSWEWDDVVFEVLYPSRNDFLSNNRSTNAQSCVLRISTKHELPQAVLLTGDIEAKQEEVLISLAQTPHSRLNADVLLMPHHGSKFSSSEHFLQTVSPHWAVAQAGYLNRYKHPALETLNRYQAQGVKTVNTADCGAALWQSSSPQTMRCTRELRTRYWRHIPSR